MLPCLIAASILSRPGTSSLYDGFLSVPMASRMRMYWRVFGPAWDRSNIDDELAEAKAVGLGGLVAYFMYPVALDDPATGIVNQRFGSPEFLRTFSYAADKAARSGLRFGFNGGTGWPYGGPSVTLADAAKKLRPIEVKEGETVPTLARGERIVAYFEDPGIVGWPLVPEKKALGRAFIFIESPTGQQVKRAAYGGEGPVLDHFNRSALERWLRANVEPLLRAGAGHMSSLGCDSLEVYSANWCSDFLQEFRRRRGYDLGSLLVGAFLGKPPVGDEVRFDYWRTLMELTEERFTKPLGEWSASHGVDLEMEAYGTPPNPMTSALAIQVPTGEHYEWRGFSVQKYVASAAHMARRNIIGSEAWTWAGLPNRLGDTLSDLKEVSNMAFLAGANDLTGVDYPYSPRSLGQPGWQPYYGPTMNRNNPQWLAFPGFVDYVSRCQWMLRQGDPKVSLGVYLPVEDALAHGGMDQMLLDFLIRDHFVTGKATSEFGLGNALKHRSDLLRGIVASGFDYDGIDFFAMNRIARVSNGALQCGTSHYKALILPRLNSMELQAAEKVAAFCRSGGLVISVGPPPAKPAGVVNKDDTVRFDSLVNGLFGENARPGEKRPYGRGSAVMLPTDAEVGPYLATVLPPQIAMSPAPESVGFVERSSPSNHVYFLANVDSDPVAFSIRLPGSGRKAQAWDAVSGAVWPIQAGQGGRFPIHLDGRGSVFIVTGRTGANLSPVPVAPTKPVEWAPQWTVEFLGPDAPPSVHTRRLESWTEWPGGRNFSGLGIYRANLDWTGHGREAVLRLEGVHEVAKVFVNGKEAGSTWAPPFEVKIGHLLKGGPNEIRIEVGNLPLDRFIGLPDQDLRLLRAKYGNRFPAPEEKSLAKEPVPSGLTGSVTILAGR